MDYKDDIYLCTQLQEMMESSHSLKTTKRSAPFSSPADRVAGQGAGGGDIVLAIAAPSSFYL